LAAAKFGDFSPRVPGVPGIRKVTAFLKVLEQHVQSYYNAPTYPDGCVERSPNYEDLAYLAVQLQEELSGERDNPVVALFAEPIAQQMQVEICELVDLAKEAVALTHDHVTSRLSSLKPVPDHCACVVDAAEAPCRTCGLNRTTRRREALPKRGRLAGSDDRLWKRR
jgi:hypothetical protein